MGEVAVTYRIMPEDVDVNLKNIEKKIEDRFSKKFKVYNMEIVPVAFGLKAIHLIIVVPDEGGLIDAIEKEILEIDGVQSAEVLNLSRLL